MDRVDCFAYENGGCVALKSKNCNGCKFYKTEQQNEDEKSKCFARNFALGLVNEDNVYYKILEAKNG